MTLKPPSNAKDDKDNEEEEDDKEDDEKEEDIERGDDDDDLQDKAVDDFPLDDSLFFDEVEPLEDLSYYRDSP